MVIFKTALMTLFRLKLQVYCCVFISLLNVNGAYAKGSDAFIVPIKPLNNLTLIQLNQIALGKKLFNDKSLSLNKKMSCATCHIASKGYADGQAFSKDNAGTYKEYNTPSIQYSVYNYYFTWTGRFYSLQEHLDFLITNATLMNRDWHDLVKQLINSTGYGQQFSQAGYSEISRQSISDAIISFERSLAKPSRLDLYLLGDRTQLTDEEITGFSLFKKSGCISCHQGINLGGNIRQQFGVMKPYFTDTVTKKRDLGYFNISKNKDDINFFRVPSLRNVSQTAPYFHDASASSLEQAIRVMFSYQLGVDASKEEVLSIKSFLMTLEPVE